MKPRTFTTLAAVTFLAALALPPVSSAQEEKKEHHHYKLFDLGTFGGPGSLIQNPSYRAMNNRGTTVGLSDTSTPDPYGVCFDASCMVTHGFVWKNGVTTDLGTLPGGASSAAASINNGGLITGQSENGLIDPLTGFPEGRGVIWRKGEIVDLGTLGGSQSNADAINDRGQVVGGALTAIPDPFGSVPQSACMELPTQVCDTFALSSLYFPGTTETHAFLWQNGFMRDLGTLGGPDSTAWINNERGEVVGWSYTSFAANPSTGVPTVDPFLWRPEDGKMTDLGSLGGTFGAPFFINNRGQVVGISNLSGDTTAHPFLWSKSTGMKDLGTLGGTFGRPSWINDAGEVVGFARFAGDQTGHAFLWRNGVMTDLGTIGTDPASDAASINSQGQIVGGTFIFGGADLRGWLWENGGPIVDLEKLVLPGSGLTVFSGNLINDRGEIAGRGRLPNGDEHAIVLIPCDENHPDVDGCDYGPVETANEVQAMAEQTTQGTASHASLASSETKVRIGAQMPNRRPRFKSSPNK
jgi:probable HAF family extracellular repeat protein